MAYADLFKREGGSVPLTAGVADPAVRRDLLRLAELGLEFETDIASIETRMSSRRNMIHNGEGRVFQRAASTLVGTAASAATGVDRWWASVNGGCQLALDRPAGVGAGSPWGWIRAFVNVIDGAVAASDYGALGHTIENLDMAHLRWGTADAKTVTLSFLFQNTMTGNFSVALRNGTATHSFVHQFAYPVANVPQRVTVTIPGPTVGTWGAAAAGIVLWWGLGVGTTFSTSNLNSWQASNAIAATGNTNMLGTLFAEMRLSEVQLEIGSAATPFEHLSYNEILAICQRYLYVFGGQSAFETLGTGWQYSTTNGKSWHYFPVHMMQMPTMAVTNLGSTQYVVSNLGASTVSVATLQTNQSSNSQATVDLTFAALGTANLAGAWRTSGVTTPRLYFQSELIA